MGKMGKHECLIDAREKQNEDNDKDERTNQRLHLRISIRLHKTFDKNVRENLLDTMSRFIPTENYETKERNRHNVQSKKFHSTINYSTKPDYAMWLAALGRWIQVALDLTNILSKIKPLKDKAIVGYDHQL